MTQKMHSSELQKTIHWFAIIGDDDYLDDPIGISRRDF